MILSGFFLGCSASIKWYGLWFLFGLVGLYLLAWVFRAFHPKTDRDALVMKVTQISGLALGLGFVITPMLTYYLLWIPHIAQNPEFQFWELQSQIYHYHKSPAVLGAVHPYCSTWQTWLTMFIPIA